ncbi:MAG: hypothetical protein ACW99R_08890 [Candidatus Hodarchaeales archaeon]|jgi:hypothetical protein
MATVNPLDTAWKIEIIPMIDKIFGTDTKYGNIWKMKRGFWWDDEGNHSIPQTPDGLNFTVDNEIERERSYLTLKGWLENTNDFLLEVPILPSPEIFNLKIINTDLIKHEPQEGPPPPAQVPPPPHVLFIDGNERIQFMAVLNLNYYEYTLGVTAIIEWTFSYWHEPRHRGRLNITLDP